MTIAAQSFTGIGYAGADIDEAVFLRHWNMAWRNRRSFDESVVRDGAYGKGLHCRARVIGGHGQGNNFGRQPPAGGIFDGYLKQRPTGRRRHGPGAFPAQGALFGRGGFDEILACKVDAEGFVDQTAGQTIYGLGL